MKNYTIKKPFAGYVMVNVDATDVQDAKSKAQGIFNEIDIDRSVLVKHNIDYCGFEFYDKMIEGNFCYIDCTKTEITCEDEEIED